MELGTHNSMTYLKPKKWYLYPFQFIARCQNLTIQEQYNKGIRTFDIRISYDKNNIAEFRHGLISYKGNVYSILEWLNSQRDPIKVRILLEELKESSLKETLFIKDLHEWITLFPNISFYEGRRKFDWKQLITLPSLETVQLISSMQGNKIDDLWPWLYAKLHNKKNVKQYFDCDKLVLLDFIEIQ